MRESTLFAQPFDNRRLELEGQAMPVAEEVGDTGGGFGTGAFSVSANDVLVFQRGAASDRQLTWYDRAGKVLETAGPPGDYENLELSPDGTRVAFSKGGYSASNIWLLDLSRGGTPTRFTFGSASDVGTVWSPDGSRIIFSSNRDGPFSLYQKPASGVKDEEILLKSNESKVASSWSRDGRFLLYTSENPKTREDIWVLPLEGDKKPVPFLMTEFSEFDARFSPDGRWVAYTSNESGNNEVYVRSFSMNSGGTPEVGGKLPISNGPATDPRWRRDGRELYYRSYPDGRLMAVEIATDHGFRPGRPQPVGSLSVAEGALGNSWDAAADGKRFLTLAAKNGSEPYTVVLNWQAGLKK
jgi:Tol biopolymer transport system component